MKMGGQSRAIENRTNELQGGAFNKLLETSNELLDTSKSPFDLCNKPFDLPNKPFGFPNKPFDLSDKLLDAFNKLFDLPNRLLDLSNGPLDVSNKPLDVSSEPLDLETEAESQLRQSVARPAPRPIRRRSGSAVDAGQDQPHLVLEPFGQHDLLPQPLFVLAGHGVMQLVEQLVMPLLEQLRQVVTVLNHQLLHGVHLLRGQRCSNRLRPGGRAQARL